MSCHVKLSSYRRKLNFGSYVPQTSFLEAFKQQILRAIINLPKTESGNVIIELLTYLKVQLKPFTYYSDFCFVSVILNRVARFNFIDKVWLLIIMLRCTFASKWEIKLKKKH